MWRSRVRNCRRSRRARGRKVPSVAALELVQGAEREARCVWLAAVLGRWLPANLFKNNDLAMAAGLR
jgi:hypothetical protein